MIDSISELIQLSVAPIFLLAAVGAILNVFTDRLTRIVIKFELLNKIANKDTTDMVKEHRILLSKRLDNINLSILYCTIAGVLVALVTMLMFLGLLFKFENTVFVAVFYIASMLSLILALLLFLKEIYDSKKFIHNKKDYSL